MLLSYCWYHLSSSGAIYGGSGVVGLKGRTEWKIIGYCFRFWYNSYSLVWPNSRVISIVSKGFGMFGIILRDLGLPVPHIVQFPLIIRMTWVLLDNTNYLNNEQHLGLLFCL